MAEETKIKTPSLPPDYVSIAVLRERWLQRQNAKKPEEEEAKKEMMKCEEGCVDGKKDDCVKGKGKKVVEEVGSGGVEKRGRNVEFCASEGNLYGNVDGMKMNVGGGGLGSSRGFRDRRINKGDGWYGGDRRRLGGRKERFEVGNEVVKGNVMDEVSKDYGGRRVNEAENDGRRYGRGLGIGNRGNEVDKGNVVEGSEGFGNRWINEGEGGGGDRRRFGRGLGGNEVEKGNVVDGWKDYGNRWIYEGESVGGDCRGFGKGGNEVEKRNVADMREEDVKVLEGSKGYGNRRINDMVDIGGKFRDLEISGGKEGGGKYGGSCEREGFGKGENGHVKRYLVDVREGNVVDVKLLEDLGETRVNEEVEIGGKFKGLGQTQVNEMEIGGNFKVLSETPVNEEVEIGGKFMDLLRNGRRDGGKYGRDRCKFGKVLGVGKGENVVEKKRNVVDVSAGSEVVKGNVVDVREENVVDGKMLEISKGNGDRIINEAVDIGRKFGDLKINGGGKRGKFRYGRERPGFRPMKEKISVAVRIENEAEETMSVAVRKEDEVEKPIAVAVRRENEAEKRNLVVVKEKNDVEKQITVAVGDGNEVKKRNLVDVKMAESSKSFGHRRGNDAVRRENEVEKRNLVDVKEKNDVEKQIPVVVIDGNEVKKRNLVDVKMAESSKGFGLWRGNEAIRGKFGGLSNIGWRKGNGKYGRGHERFGSWKNKQEESGMMWVKKADAEADSQA